MDISKALLIDGWMFDYELELISGWASNHNKIIEIGAWKGRTTRALCDNTKGMVVTIDHWKGALIPIDDGFWEVEKYGSDYVYNMFLENLKDHINSGKLSVLRMSSDLAANLLIQGYGFESFDMIFIDGGHEYDVVKKDIIFFRPLIKKGGKICGHDLCYPEVKKVLDELLPGYQSFGNIWSKEN